MNVDSDANYKEMKKYITDFKVVANEQLSDRLFILRLTPADGSPIAPCHAGQFAELRVDDEPRVFLRRPISIHRVDYDANEMWLLIQRAGHGTNRFACLRARDQLNIIYPLGNGFTIEEQVPDMHYLLIGGGVGVAPLLETGYQLKQRGARVSFLLGGKSCAEIAQVAQFLKVGNVYITAEDGSVLEGLDCQRGFVTQHSVLKEGSFDAIRVCGPGPMMKAVARLVSSWKQNERPHFCEVSLENKMACGLGVCLCCVEDTKDGHKCVCSDGPVFDIKDLKW